MIYEKSQWVSFINKIECKKRKRTKKRKNKSRFKEFANNLKVEWFYGIWVKAVVNPETMKEVKNKEIPTKINKLSIKVFDKKFINKFSDN